MPASNSMIKFADDTTVVGLITNNEETAYREVRALGVWCQENNHSLNVNKTKEMIVDFRKQQKEHPPIHIEGTAVEKVESFKFICVHITDKLKWWHDRQRISIITTTPLHDLDQAPVPSTPAPTISLCQCIEL